ncbi:MAG: cytochrome b/b6 domain-containing protein, partial [Pseudomonadota bacterium]
MTATQMMTGYGLAARWLHWLVAGLIVLQYVLAELADEAGEGGALLQQLALLANHKSVGMTILGLAVVRLGWRFGHAPPPLPAQTAPWQSFTAKGAHWLLYGLLLALPISGWLMSSASAYSVSWFNLFSFPDLVGADEGLKETLVLVHEFLAKTLFIVALAHIGAALYHHVWLKDDVLRGMANMAAIGVSVLLVAVGIGWLGSVSSAPAEVAESATAEDAGARLSETSSAAKAEGPPDAAAIPGAEAATATSTLPLWNINPDASEIVFIAEQAGAEFEGRFNNWSAEIYFDPENLEESSAVVAITLASVFTDDSDRDSQLLGDEWFGDRDATFRASDFVAEEDGAFAATDATLDFGGDAYPIEFS